MTLVHHHLIYQAHVGNDKLGADSQIIALLDDALKKQYGLSISTFTLLELINTSTIENEVKSVNATSALKHFEVTQEVLIAAGHLGCMYKDDGMDGNKQKPPDVGDKIIAASAVMHDAVIFTINGRDFPQPFFNIIAKPILIHTQPDGREVHTPSYFIEPDLDYIGKKHNERISEHEKKTTPKKPKPKKEPRKE